MTTPKPNGWEELLTTELKVLLGEYQMTGDDARIVNVLELVDQAILSAEENLLREIMEEMPKRSPFISQLCQNRNLNDYCGTCEQAWEDCSCPARNTGFNSCHDQVNTILERKLSTVKK